MNVDEYLSRIGAGPPRSLDIGTLRELQVRHLETVPFENLSVSLGQPIDLHPGALFDKIVRHRRGGFCYELNGLFAGLLGELGFEVELRAARVARREGGFGPPLDHLALRVRLDEPWLVDVGFGRFSMAPLRFATDVVQEDRAGRFSLRDAAHGDVDVLHDGVVAYRLENRPRDLEEFQAMAWFQTNSPDVHFTHGPTCSRATPAGRITLARDRLIETVGDERTERRLDGAEEILAAYREYFGIDLDRVPSQGLDVRKCGFSTELRYSY
ncbi:arylamine N-acetyltransferase [Actinocrispum sp. NPDC049592]|uniref:arylamine N-acetyltransferase family protein n=1 Tax=Actinocrispum sp. NPDC049592 TaxID=3154835 RepID=UPI0034150FAB